MKRSATSPTPVRRVIFYWAPALVWMAAIFAVSSLSRAAIEQATSPVQGFPIVTEAAVAHVVEYGVLAMLAYRLLRSYRALAAPYLWTAVLLLTTGYGVTDELHQSFVPGRDSSLQDIGYDALGALIGLLVAEVTVAMQRRVGRSS